MAGGQNLGEAVLKITLDTKTLKTQLDQLKKDIEGVQAGPVKLKPDGTSTRSRTTPADTAAKKAAADEARRVSSLNALEARRFRIGRELNKLEERGVNISRLRSKLESNTLRRRSSQAEITSAREQTRSLERQVALRKDLADKEKRANAATKQAVVAPPPPPPKPPRLPDRGLDRTPLQGSVREVGSPAFGTRGARQGGQSESINARTDAQRKRARLNQQLNSLEASGVKTTKLRAQLGEATTAQANRQFGTFNQIANKLSESLRAEREKLKIQKQQTRENEKQVTEEKRIGKLNASPVRGGIAFKGSPIAEEVAARKQQRLAKDLDAGAMERAANRRAKIENRIDYLSTGGRDQSVRSAVTPLRPNAEAIKADKDLDKARKATAATTEKEARRIAKDNASPVGGRIGDKESPAFKAAEEKRTQERNARRAKKLSDRQDYLATGGRDQLAPSRMAVPFVGDPSARNKARAKRDKDRSLRDSRLNSALVGGAFPLQFGQGGFASAGGLIGGAVGGGPLGFGLSLVGTLVGSQIDELSNRFITLSKALQDPIKSLDVFIEQASLASTAQEKLAKTLIDNGQEGRAESLIAGELARTIDPAIASRVDANTDNFNRALSDTKDILGQIVAGPSSEFLNFLAGILSTVSAVPSAPNPNATPEQRQKQTVDNANKRKIPAQIAGSVSSGLLGPALGGFLTGALTSGEDKDIRVAKSKEVFALEKKLSKEKKTQQQIEEATLVAQSQGLEDTAKQLSLQAKLAGVTVKETKANKGAAEELERSKFFGFGSGDTKKAEDKRKEIKETADLERKALLAEQAGEKRSSGIKLSNAQRLRGLEGPARDIQTKKNSVSEAQREADSAQQIKNQRIKESTGSTKDKALITAASDAATTANNKLKLSKVELNETTEKAIKLAGRELDLAKSAVKGDRIGSLNKQINNVEEDRNFSLRKLGAGASLQEKEAVNLSADAKVLELQQQKKQLQNDLNQALQSELIIRQGIAKQITAAIANQGAALARADAGANPGNSVLAARAGRAEGDAFKAQNQSGINAAKDNESQLRNQLRFEPDTSKQTELVDKIRTAAEATKLAYIEAGTALAEKIGAAAASLKGMRDSLRGTLEGNIDLLPGQDVQNLRNMAQADINRGQRNGILRSDLAPAQTDEEQFRQAGFVRSVENQKAQIQSQQELIKALNDNAAAERNITVQVELGGSPVPVGDRTASTL